MSDVEHFALLNKVYARYAHYNPLHADMFAAAVRMEREVVAMTASLLGGGPGGASSVCGCVTSGGSESILTAIRATRDFFAAARGGCGADAGAPVPELVAATTAHAAVHKACAYFGVRLVTVPVDSRGGLCVASARRAVRPGVTALIYASAPGFPHGVVDDVPALGALALQAGCGLHVDACLGAFVLPFAAEAGHPALGRQPFDFSVPGVTSMSADTHKFGQAAKGSSVVLYGGAALRRCQYTAVTDWPGGLYVSPGAPGSRPGGLVACAWAALVHLGRDGLVAATRRILDAAAELAAGVAATPGLAPLGAAAGGSPTMVVAFRSTDARVPIFVVNDVLTQMGWHLNALQRPPALHFCVTAANCGAVPELVQALGEAVASVRARGGAAAAGSGGMAPVYGLAGGVPDRGAVGDLLKGVQDQILDT